MDESINTHHDPDPMNQLQKLAELGKTPRARCVDLPVAEDDGTCMPSPAPRFGGCDGKGIAIL